MSEHENLALLQRIYDRLLTQGDPNLLFNSLSDDITIRLTIAADTALGGEFRGKDGAATYFQRLNDAIEMGGIQVLEMVPHKDTVIVIGKESGRIRATGKEFTNDWVTIFTCRNGQISNILVIEDTTLVVEGLRSQAAK